MWKVKVWFAGKWLYFTSTKVDEAEALAEIKEEATQFYKDWMRGYYVENPEITLDKPEWDSLQ